MSDTIQRKCGDCTLCCKLLPVPELAKPKNARCPHQRFGKGCANYSHRPRSCMMWSCRWLIDATTRSLSRPDAAGYVIDMVPDFATITPIIGEPRKVEVIQIWVDPKRPHAHRDPRLRSWLSLQYLDRAALGLVRNGDEGTILWPPECTGDGWVEHTSRNQDGQHSAKEVMDALAEIHT